MENMYLYNYKMSKFICFAPFRHFFILIGGNIFIAVDWTIPTMTKIAFEERLKPSLHKHFNHLFSVSI